MKIQINELLNTQSIPNFDKKKDKDSLNKKYNLGYWKTYDVSNFQELSNYVSKGFSIRPGIRTDGNDSKDFIIGYDFIVFDVDGGCSIRDCLAADNDEVIGLLYPTPGYTKEVEKFRIVCKLEKHLSGNDCSKKYEELYNFYSKKYFPYADKATRLGSYFFYGAHPNFIDKIYVNEFCNSLNIDMDYAIDVVSNVVSKSQVLPSIETSESKLSYENYEEYFSNNLRDIISDPNKFFWLHPHNFSETVADKPDISKKYQGSNPFSPTDSSGKSFVVSYLKDTYLPVWYDRSSNVTTSKSKSGGNYLDYVICYYQEKHGIQIDFKEASNIICEHFGLPKYEFKSPTKFYDDWDTYYQLNSDAIYGLYKTWLDRVKSTGDSWDNKSFPFFYMQSNYVWVLGNYTKIFIEFKKWLFLNHPELETNHHTKFHKAFYDNFYHIALYETERLYNPPNENVDYVAFSNGYFCLSENKFKGYVKDVFNLQGYDFPFIPISDIESKQILGELKDYYKLSYSDNPENAEIIYIWTLLNVLGVAYMTENHLGLTGAAGGGKTTNLELIRLLSSNKGKSVTPESFAEENRFSLWSLIGARSIFINEFPGTQKYIRAMNRITGTGKPQNTSVEPKGGKAYEYLSRWSITTATEGTIGITGTALGAMRRYVFIEHTHTTVKKGSDKDLIKEKLSRFHEIQTNRIDGYLSSTNSYIQKIIIAVHQTLSYLDLLKDWKKVTNTKYQDELKHKISLENSTYGEFINSYLIVTNEKSDFITKDELNNMANHYNMSYQKSYDKIGIGSRAMTGLKNELIALFGWKFGDSSPRQIVNGKKVTIYLGIKQKNLEEYEQTDVF